MFPSSIPTNEQRFANKKHLKFIAWLVLAITIMAGHNATAQTPTIYRGLLYALRDGVPLYIDIMVPQNPNGAGIIHIQSGGWYSSRRDAAQLVSAESPFLNLGYTVFLVYHSNPPTYTVPHMVEDVRRATRFIRIFAPVFQVDPDRLASVGTSSGGHLSLMLATTGDDGIPTSSDPVEHYSSRVKTAVAINAPSDLRYWTTSPPPGVAAEPVLDAPLNFSASLEASVSPILHVDNGDAPTYMIHGTADQMVPVEYSERMYDVFNTMSVGTNLQLLQGAGHVIAPQYVVPMVTGMMNWLATHL